jgi:hypothetical protein
MQILTSKARDFAAHLDPEAVLSSVHPAVLSLPPERSLSRRPQICSWIYTLSGVSAAPQFRVEKTATPGSRRRAMSLSLITYVTCIPFYLLGGRKASMK